ncbi:MAG: AAA family ATPase [Kiritimatiellae bacterium]|nr:AAA family ATPase [Kiritimatiellia bacterium]
MEKITHQVITASAGTGKTFQLAHRYIRLMAYGVSPDRIIALAFSRKAAGEIFDSIIEHLSRAVGSDDGAKEMGARIERPDLHQTNFLKILHRLLQHLHRIHISTLDRFIVGIVRTFPAELGLPMQLDIFDPENIVAKSIRQDILRTLFNHHDVDSNAQITFLHAFKQATFGQEEKGLERALDAFVNEYLDAYRILPNGNLWGARKIIWPDEPVWVQPVKNIQEIAKELKRSFGESRFHKTLLKSLTQIIDFSGQYSEEAVWDNRVGKSMVFQKLLAYIDEGERAEISISYAKKEYRFTFEQSQQIRCLLRHVMGVEFHRALMRTKGLYRILDQYDHLYHTRMHRQGSLTFEDAQHLLTSKEGSRLYIDYRLDCKLDHWLLDEFQDTSDMQWEVFRNVVDEIVQDPSGERSFFYVGDVKQAIYGWRGGNAQLFGRILEQYGDRIEQRPLNTSFRSCQPIIDTVNEVFGRLPDDLFSVETIAGWNKIWIDHQIQKEVVPSEGYVALLEPDNHNGETKPTDEDRYETVARILKEINPLKCGLSVAVLVRTNHSGKDVVNMLRRACPDLHIVHEGKREIHDSPVVSLLLSLIKFAAHPGDMFAWRHLEMSPLKVVLSILSDAQEDLPLILLEKMQVLGFQGFIRYWGDKIEASHPLDAFGKKRLQDLVDAAGEFDALGRRDANTFLRFIDHYHIHEIAAEQAVRVMTIHQAKGLDFDIVILPDLQGRNMVRAGQIDFVMARDRSTNQNQWALKMPRRLMAESDSVLAEQVKAEDEKASMDALCVLYVAMTRAKRALYMLTAFPGKSATTTDSATFVKYQLSGELNPIDGPRMVVHGKEVLCLYEKGARDWYTKIPEVQATHTSKKKDKIAEDFHERPSRRKRFSRVSPSGQAEERQQSVTGLLSESMYQSLDFGTAVHELFERVSWIEEEDLKTIIQDWREASSYNESLKQKAIENFRDALVAGEVKNALSKPKGPIELWKEKNFEIILNDEWVTGTFDRVTIFYADARRPIRATILDYKTNQIADDDDYLHLLEHYRPQLTLYQRVLAEILKIDAGQITLQLLFTRLGKVCEVVRH